MNKYWGVAFLIFLAISLGTASAATENDTWSRWGSKGNHSHIKATSNCCSVIVNVNDTCAVFAYRRDRPTHDLKIRGRYGMAGDSRNTRQPTLLLPHSNLRGRLDDGAGAILYG